MIPLIDLHRLHNSIHSELMEAIERIVNSCDFILGKEVASLERRVAKYLGVSHAIGVASGTAALEIALRSLDVRGEPVLTTSFSFVATATAIRAAGGVPYFCDIDPRTFQMDVPQAIMIADQLRPKVILPVHLFGEMLDVAPLCEWAAANDAYVVEDAAQSFGARRGTVFAGTQGDIGCYSFFPTKNLGAMGDGGAIVTNQSKLASKLLQLREPLVNGTSIPGATNGRLDALQAAVLNIKLNHLDAWNQTRREIAQRYESALGNQPDVVCPSISEGGIVHQYALRVPRREALSVHLEQREISTRIYYPKILPDYLGMDNAASQCPWAAAISGEVISLPIHPHLTRNEQDHIIDSVLEFCGVRAKSVS